MRLDKFLKVSRLIKRRTIAKEVADNNRIMINDKLSKASSEVNVNDIIKISFGNKVVTVRVTKIQESARKDEVDHMYEVLKEEKL